MAGVAGLRCVVTGGSGFVGRRLVEMLVERGAKSVVSFDVRPSPTIGNDDLNFITPEQEKRVEYIVGDLCKSSDLNKAFEGADVVFHIAAVVGPYHPKPLYMRVNYEGTLNVLEACKTAGVQKLVSSSSPSTRFTGVDVSGAIGQDMPFPEPGKYTAAYAETKAMGERAVSEWTERGDILAVNVAPHQVYGPRDALFLPNFLVAAKTGQLRVIGSGNNRISMCHVDNYCHGLILAADQLFAGSPVLGKFYIVTDGAPQNLWGILDQAVVDLGGNSLLAKYKVPLWIIYPVAYIVQMMGWLTGMRFRLTPFSVCMLTIDRYFDISTTKRDLKYEPLIGFEEGWKGTIEWMRKRPEWWQAAANATGR